MNSRDLCWTLTEKKSPDILSQHFENKATELKAKIPTKLKSAPIHEIKGSKLERTDGNMILKSVI